MKILRATLLLFATLFTMDSWATPLVCEVLMQTSYGRILKLLTERNLITADELAELKTHKLPVSAYRNRPRNEGNLSIHQAFDKAVARPETKRDWTAILNGVDELMLAGQKIEESVGEAKIQTKKIVNPKLVSKFQFGERFTFVNNGTGLAIWSMDRKGGKLAVHDFSTGGSHEDVFDHSRVVLARKNGEIWSLGSDGEKTTDVKIWPRRKSHFEMEYDHRVRNQSLYESPSGKVWLSMAGDGGVTILDVTNRKPQTMLDIGDKGFQDPTYHVTRQGNLYVAVPMYTETIIYKLVRGKLKEFSRVSTDYNPVRALQLVSDSKGTLYLGEGVPESDSHYRVVKFVNKKPEIFWRAPEDIKSDRMIELFVNAQDQVILSTVFRADEKTLKIINLSSKGGLPAIEIPLTSDLTSKPSWFTLPNGKEVLAVSPEFKKTLIVSTQNGLVEGIVDALSSFDFPPAWIQLEDGRVLLAVESHTKEIRVFDVWRNENGSGAKP